MIPSQGLRRPGLPWLLVGGARVPGGLVVWGAIIHVGPQLLLRSCLTKHASPHSGTALNVVEPRPLIGKFRATMTAKPPAFPASAPASLRGTSQRAPPQCLWASVQPCFTLLLWGSSALPRSPSPVSHFPITLAVDSVAVDSDPAQLAPGPNPRGRRKLFTPAARKQEAERSQGRNTGF